MSEPSSPKSNETPRAEPSGGGDSPSPGGSKSNASTPKKRRRVDRLLGTHLAGKYKILKKIGEGGMGSVYIANQEPIDRKVAVKVLLSKLAEDEVSVKRFEQEARAISKMQHPNTVTIYDFGQVDAEDGAERLYIVMEYLKGLTLTQVLRKEGALPGPRASRIMRQVCASLADAHGAGIIHRDLKPDNIFLSELGGEKDWVKVLDFGVAKLADSEAAGTLTQTGMIFGTPKYMSPEQAEGKPIDYRADIYALGVVLYELLAGKPPFISDTPVGLLLKHISEPPKPLSEVAAERDVDPRLEAIVLRALEKHPDRRQQQVTELAAELEQYERAVTGPQAIPTDVGHLSPGTGPATGRSGLPTEVVPGTMPGQPVSPSGLVPPDHVPFDLSAGVPSGAPSSLTGPGALSGATGAAAASTGQATAQAAPLAGGGLTAPVPAGRGTDTVGTGLSGEFSGSLPKPKRDRGGLALALVVLAVVGAGGAYALWGRSFEAPEVVPLQAASPSGGAPELPAPREPSAGPEETPPGPERAAAPALDPAPSERPEEPSDRRRDRPERAPASRRERAEAAARAEPERRAPQPSPTVEIRLRSTPPGATVTLGGRQVGVTPAAVPVPRGDDLLTFVFEKRGYARAEKLATSARDTEVAVELERRARPTPKAPSRPAKKERCPDGTKPPCESRVDPLDLRVDDLK